MIDDVFCKIINKEIDAEIIMEEEDWLAFKDLHPAAPVHILIVPKKHIGSILEIADSDGKLIGELIIAAKKVAQKMGLDKGFRIIINNGSHGGQMVPHLHLHLLGGRPLGAKIVRDPEE